MTYSNNKYNFSMRLPDNWKTEKDFFKVFTNKVVDFSRASGGSIGISVFRVKKEDRYDKERLEKELLDSLNDIIATGEHKNAMPYLVNRKLDNEIDTAWGEFVYKGLNDESEMFWRNFCDSKWFKICHNLSM